MINKTEITLIYYLNSNKHFTIKQSNSNKTNSLVHEATTQQTTGVEELAPEELSAAHQHRPKNTSRNKRNRRYKRFGFFGWLPDPFALFVGDVVGDFVGNFVTL